MASTTAPVREGEYGERVIAIEPGGIEFIPESERHGKPFKLFWTWNSPNWEFATVFVGAVVFLLGGGFWLSAVAVLVGTGLGCLSHFLLSSMGPRYGVPQLVQSRGAFGYVGNFLPAGLNTVFAGIGWFIVNSVSGTFALTSLTELMHRHFGFPAFAFQLSLVIIVVLQVFVAFIGHNFIHSFERFVFPYLFVVFTISCIIIFAHSNPGIGYNPKATGPMGQSGAFLLGVFISFGYAIGWNPFASDYSRYLPATSNRFMVGLWSALGVFIPCVLLEVAGAASATVVGTNYFGASPTDQFIKPLPDLLAALTLLGISTGTVSANVLNIYSASMSFLALGLKMGGFRLRRAVTALGLGVVGLIVAFALQANVGPGSKYETFLLTLGYWITPFLGVVFVDYWLRHGEYRESVFFDRGRRTWKGAAAMLIGIVCTYFFWNQQPPFQPGSKPGLGAIPGNWPQLGDLSFIVGFGVAAILYLLFSRIGREAAPAPAR
ncbi:MAG: purine-cytosine permease family protein [Candidatus Dormibacteraceae bacterium]